MRVPLLALVLLLAGCSAPDAEPTPGTPPPPVAGGFTLASAAFGDGEAIPVRYTCDGDDVSPPLTFSGVPANATTVALIMADPDVPVPQAPQRNLTHWLVWDAPVENGTVTFEEGRVPEGAVEGASEANPDGGYGGPCPPALSPPHRYVFTAYAVEGTLRFEEGSDRAALEAELDGNVVAVTSLTGTYARAAPASP